MFQNKQSEATSFFLDTSTPPPLDGSAPMLPGTYVPRPRYRCSPNLCSPVPMFLGIYVPRYRCSPVFVLVISTNRLQIIPTPWYDSRLGLCLGFIFMVRVTVRLELQTVFRLWLGCGLGLSLYGYPNPKLALTKTQN